MQKAKNNRPIIAFFISETEGDYSYQLCRGVVDGVAYYDVNLVIFPGKTQNSPHEYQYQYNIIYDLVDKENFDALILPMSALNSFKSDDELKKFYKHYEGMPIVSITLPLDGATNIIIDNKRGFRDAINHLIREHGRRQIAFIKGTPLNIDAEERYSAYLEVLEENGIAFNSDLVCQGDFTVFSAIEAMNILLDERKVSFDALVAANDEMALAALDILKSRGFRVPEDISLVGFDDVLGGQISNPTLTTVRQPIYEIGWKSVELACKLLQGEENTTVTVPTEAVFRESCGCQKSIFSIINQYVSDDKPSVTLDPETLFLGEMNMMRQPLFNKEKVYRFIDVVLKSLEGESSLFTKEDLLNYFTDILEDKTLSLDHLNYLQGFVFRLRYAVLSGITEINKLRLIGDFFEKLQLMIFDSYQKQNAQRWLDYNLAVKNLRSVLNSMVSYVNSREAMVTAAAKALIMMKIGFCLVYLYENEIYHSKDSSWTIPDTVINVLTYPETAATQLKIGQSVKTKEIFSSKMLQFDERFNIVINPLFFLEHQIGLILCEFKMINGCFYESLFMEMGCALKFSYLINAKEHTENRLLDTLRQLEQYNKELSDLSQTDELTGLYNRRGFFNIVKQNLNLARQERKNGYLFYADLDRLKEINDIYGHDEGDHALRQMGLILRAVFRSSDIIARIGGDEFTIFAVDATPKSVAVIDERLRKQVASYNGKSGKPYDISISMGAVPFSYDQLTSLESLLEEADMRLYEQKKLKKRNCVK